MAQSKKFTPSLDKAPFALKPIQNDARRQLLDLLDTVRGKKALVLEPHFVQPLGLIVDALTLKEHGVEMFCVLENDPGVVAALLARGVRHLVYLIHARVGSIQGAAAHAAAARSAAAGAAAPLNFTALLMPRAPRACELLLDAAGLLGDMSARAYPLSWVPLEEDVLSLEAPAAFRELAVEGDTSVLWDLAHALTALQGAWGAIPHVKGKGPWAAAVVAMLGRMRREAGAAAPAPGADGGGIDALVLLDRTVDMVTPMCTQLTYEGLLDEILGLSHGQIRGAPAGGAAAAAAAGLGHHPHPAHHAERKVAGLNSADPVFHETRDLFYLGARKWLNETLRSIQQFRDAGMAGADITQLKGFVAELRDKFARIPLHTSLVEALGEALRAPGFGARQRVEAALLDERDDLGAICEAMEGGEGLLPVLRMLCLYCAVHGGVPRRAWDALRRDLVNTYGHGHLATLHALGAAGLLQAKPAGRDARRPGFAAAKPALRLLMGEGEAVDPENPADIYFTYAGYAPLSVRLAQQALAPGGWPAAEAALAALLGPQVEVLQAVDDEGMPVEQRDPGGGAAKAAAAGSGDAAAAAAAAGEGPPKRRRTVMVVFIGGVTHAEISALRFLSRKGMVDADFLVGTTKIVNGSSLLAPLLAPEA